MSKIKTDADIIGVAAIRPVQPAKRRLVWRAVVGGGGAANDARDEYAEMHLAPNSGAAAAAGAVKRGWNKLQCWSKMTTDNRMCW